MKDIIKTQFSKVSMLCLLVFANNAFTQQLGSLAGV